MKGRGREWEGRRDKNLNTKGKRERGGERKRERERERDRQRERERDRERDRQTDREIVQPQLLKGGGGTYCRSNFA